MTPSLVAMIGAEARKVFTRGTALLALLTAATLPLLVVGLMWQLKDGGPTVNGADVGTMITYSAVEVGSWSLTARNFLVLPLFLGLATALSVAGELNDRTLREVLVRPVSRETVLFVRVVALGLLSLASLVLTAAAAIGVGLLSFGLPAPPLVPEGYPGLGAVLSGYGVSFLCDIGVILLVMAVSLFIRSVGLTLVVLVLGWGADFLLRKVLGLLSSLGVVSAGQLLPWTLGNALDAWEGWQDGFEWPRFVALAVVGVAAALVAVLRFRRIDLP